jgi:hypothetical protein
VTGVAAPMVDILALMDQAKVRVVYDQFSDDGLSDKRHEIVLEGFAEARFVDVLEAATEKSDYNRNYTATLSDPELPYEHQVTIDPGVSLGAVAQWIGDETLHLDNGGRGGGGEPGATLLELINAGMWVGGVGTYTYAAYRAALRVKFAEHAREAQAWDDADAISPRLEQLVKAERWWIRRDFDRAFRLDRHRGSLLLRQLGYRQMSTGASEFWEEINLD